MPAWGSYSYVFGPLVAFALMAVFALVLRWAFSRGHSLVQDPVRPGRVDDYGLLVAVAEPDTFIEAELAALRLREAGLRATLAPTRDGPRVMVFERDRARALRVLAS